jgi:hypothetical protein
MHVVELGEASSQFLQRVFTFLSYFVTVYLMLSAFGRNERVHFSVQHMALQQARLAHSH